MTYRPNRPNRSGAQTGYAAMTKEALIAEAKRLGVKGVSARMKPETIIEKIEAVV